MNGVYKTLRSNSFSIRLFDEGILKSNHTITVNTEQSHVSGNPQNFLFYSQLLTNVEKWRS